MLNVYYTLLRAVPWYRVTLACMLLLGLLILLSQASSIHRRPMMPMARPITLDLKSVTIAQAPSVERTPERVPPARPAQRPMPAREETPKRAAPETPHEAPATKHTTAPSRDRSKPRSATAQPTPASPAQGDAAAPAGQSLFAYLKLECDTQGHVLNLFIDQGSGNDDFDMQALEEAKKSLQCDIPGARNSDQTYWLTLEYRKDETGQISIAPTESQAPDQLLL